MPIEMNMDNITMSLFNAETGENLGELDGINDVQMEVNTKYEAGYKDNNKVCHLPTKSNYEMTFDCDTTDVNIEALLGFDKANKPDAYDITFIKYVQCRIHKKKRINKKWKKKYGYKTIKVISKGWNIKTYADGTFEFKKDSIETNRNIIKQQ